MAPALGVDSASTSTVALIATAPPPPPPLVGATGTATATTSTTTSSTTHSHSEPPESPHPHAMMTSDEVDALVHSYLSESGYTHTAFSLLHESSLAGPLSSLNTTQINGRKNVLNAVLDDSIPPGHLVRILQKGLLYLEAEARYRGDPKEPSPRLIGYTIPNTMPLPPLPRVVHKQPTPAPAPPPSAPPATASSPSASTSTSVLAAATPSDMSSSRPPAPITGVPKSEKAKGKEKESASALASNANGHGKRKGSDREDASSETGKRPRMAGGEGGKKATKVNGAHADDAMEVDPPPAAVGKKGANGSAGSTPRSVSPSVPRKPKPNHNLDGHANHKKRPASISSSGNAARATTVVSAPTSPSDPSSTANMGNDRRSSLPEGEKKAQAELSKVKNEEGEAQDGANKKKKQRGPKSASGASGKTGLTDSGGAASLVDKSRAVQWSAEKGPVRLLQGHTTAKVQACTWNPKVPSLLATGATDSTCRIWDVPGTRASSHSDKREIIKDNIVLKHASAQRRVDVSAIAWDPSGSLLATGSEDGIVRIWTASGDLHLVLSMHQRAILTLQWNRLGTMLLTGSIDGTVCLWEISSGKVKQQWATHADSVLHLDWNDDQTFASASSDKTIHLFNVARVTPVYRFKGHRDDVNFVKFSPCGTMLASVSDDHSLRLWSLRNIPGLTMDDAKMFSARDDDRLIDNEENAGQLVLEGHTADVHALAWAPVPSAGSGGPRLVASAAFDNTARLWDADAGVCLHTFAYHIDWLYSISFSPGGSFLATGSNDGKLHVWRVKDRSLAFEYTHTGPVYELAWRANGKQLAVCGKSHDVGVVDFDESDEMSVA